METTNATIAICIQFLPDEESGIPKTQKGNKKAHGFGLQNIKSVVEKYYGDVLIEQKENKVSLKVMLLADV